MKLGSVSIGTIRVLEPLVLFGGYGVHKGALSSVGGLSFGGSL